MKYIIEVGQTLTVEKTIIYEIEADTKEEAEKLYWEAPNKLILIEEEWTDQDISWDGDSHMIVGISEKEEK